MRSAGRILWWLSSHEFSDGWVQAAALAGGRCAIVTVGYPKILISGLIIKASGLQH